jgi:beta-1,4-N-acetylglucosaminyltransferase
MNTILTVVNAGGHLTQALCVMKQVENFHLVTSVVLHLNVGAQSVTVVKGTQFNPFIHLWNVFVAYRTISRTQPKAIFSTGGPICLPYALVAKVLNKKFVYLDTLSRVEDLSNTARLLYKYKLADEIYCQWQNVADKYPGIECYGKTFDICGENVTPENEN